MTTESKSKTALSTSIRNWNIAEFLALGLERLWSRTPPAETTSETPESDGESSTLLVDSPGCSPLDGRAPSEGDEEGDER